MRGHFALYVLGVALLSLAAVLLLFTAYAGLVTEPYLGFLLTALAAGLLGFVFYKMGNRYASPSTRETLAAVLLSWLVVPLFGALPYLISGVFQPLDALFESMSGFTTTGATVLQDFGLMTSSLFMWRSLSQWFGGIGIIVVFIAVLPQLAIAGRQLFFTEAPGPMEEKLTPRLRNTAKALLLVYGGLTVACMLAYLLGGMNLYDALSHALTTLASGGFSPKPNSFEDFASPTLEWIAILFMLLAGANFALLYRVFIGRPKELLLDPEFRAYLTLTVVMVGFCFWTLLDSQPASEALRQASFQVVSIITTTGYASVDFEQWQIKAQLPLILLMFTGASAGSAAGGIKIVRLLMIASSSMREVRLSLHPRRVLPVRVGKRIIPEEVWRSVAAFISLYVLLFVLGVIVLIVFGADYVTAFTASIACLGNIGPGLATVGPMENFAHFHPISKGFLVFLMYAGRLEVVTVFVVLEPRWWKPGRRGLFGHD